MYDSMVVLGDSFAEGLDDRRPDGSFRGWADLVAAVLAQRAPGFTYANLAIRGKKLAEIRDEQLQPALSMRPALATIAGGGNDMLRPSCDVAALRGVIRETTAALRGSGGDVVVFAGADPRGGLPLSKTLRNRVQGFNAGVRETAAESGARLVDLWHLEELYQPRMWSVDRLHLSRAGHTLVANEVLRVLEVADHVELPADDLEPHLTWTRGLANDLAWGRDHLVPWLIRHARGRSSGDGLQPKAPYLAPPPHAAADLAG